MHKIMNANAPTTPERFVKGQQVKFRQGAGPLQTGTIDCRIGWITWLVVLPDGTELEVLNREFE